MSFEKSQLANAIRWMADQTGLRTQLLGNVAAGVAALGALTLCRYGRKFLAFSNRHYLRPLLQSRSRLIDTYSLPGPKKSWAVVTGGSDGIGLAMCKHLAAQGFNICIIARNRERMEKVLDEIKKETPLKIETMYI